MSVTIYSTCSLSNIGKIISKEKHKTNDFFVVLNRHIFFAL